MKNKVHRQHILENLIYALIWIIVFTAPVFRNNDENVFSWQDVTREWIALLPFLVVFCINNYVLIPYLLTRKRMWWYFIITIGMVFMIFTNLPHPKHPVTSAKQRLPRIKQTARRTPVSRGNTGKRYNTGTKGIRLPRSEYRSGDYYYSTAY